MPDQDPFTNTPNTNTNTNTQATPAPQADPFADKLNAIQTEDGRPKYDSVEKALDALQASQQFIETLKTEKASVESQLQQVTREKEQLGNIDDFVNRIRPPAQTPEPQATPTAESGLSEEKVTQLLQQQFEQREKQSQRERNLAVVTEQLSNKLGDKSSEFIRQRATELGTTAASLREMAMDNPKVALSLLDVPTTTTVSPSQSSISLTNQPKLTEMPKHERGIAAGGLTNAQLIARLKESQEYTNKRLGVVTSA